MNNKYENYLVYFPPLCKYCIYSFWKKSIWYLILICNRAVLAKNYEMAKRLRSEN